MIIELMFLMKIFMRKHQIYANISNYTSILMHKKSMLVAKEIGRKLHLLLCTILLIIL